jgi:aminoglycoside phosphotransferase (APT) family kinase protein
MRYTTLPRNPRDFQQPPAPEQIQAICDRAFGPAEVHSARELGGGEFNSIYAVRIAGRPPVVLRAAPAADRAVPWHDHLLMRREHSIQPYFAPIAPLLPRTLVADFSRELIDRDYLMQTRMPGRQWRHVAPRLSADETASLLRQTAGILHRIHQVRGTAFGDPWPGQQYFSWSETMLDWLVRSLADAASVGIETAGFRDAVEMAQAGAAALDEVRVARLLHGDLWTFNLLVRRGDRGPTISAVLDYDRACWGDPLLEWTFHLLPWRASADEQAIFWEAYGRPSEDAATRFRIALYEVFHIGNVLADVRRRSRDDLLPRVYAAQGEALAILRAAHVCC